MGFLLTFVEVSVLGEDILKLPSFLELKKNLKRDFSSFPVIPVGSSPRLSTPFKEEVLVEGFIGSMYDHTGDNPYAVIHVPENPQDKSILVIKDSYGNAFVPYLTEHYGNIVVVYPSQLSFLVQLSGKPAELNCKTAKRAVSLARGSPFIIPFVAASAPDYLHSPVPFAG